MQCDVAEQYGLYMKITGAQRIDMFGAHVEDLPNIWEQLVTAGYESGHAYAKALRAVKSWQLLKTETGLQPHLAKLRTHRSFRQLGLRHGHMATRP